jgi:hypothetical protein
VLPLTRRAFRTGEPPEAVAARLAEVVAIGRAFRGSVTVTQFKLRRTLGWFARRTWQPVILGELVPLREGNEMRVRMRPTALEAAGWGIAFCIFAPVLLAGAWAGELWARVWTLGFAGIYLASGLQYWLAVRAAWALLSESMGWREPAA